MIIFFRFGEDITESLILNSDLIFQVAENGSVQQLHEINLRHTRLDIAVSLSEVNENLVTPVQLAISKKHFGVIASMIKPLKFSIGNESFRPACTSVITQIISSNQLSIIEKLECLIGTDTNSNCWLEFILQSIKSTSSITRQEKIVAMELIGATFIFKDINPENFEIDDSELNAAQRKAFREDCEQSDKFTLENQNEKEVGIQCWKEAMALRDCTADGEPAIPKIAYLLSDNDIFGKITEVMSKEDLDYFEQRTSLIDYWKNLKYLQIHSLLVMQRILNQHPNPDKRPFLLYLRNLLCYRDRCWSRGRYSRSLNTSLLILEKLDGFDSSFPYTSIDVFTHTLLKIPEYLTTMKESLPNNQGQTGLTSIKVFRIVKSYLDTLKLMAITSINSVFEWMKHSEQLFNLMRAFVDFMKFLYYNDWFPNFKSPQNMQLTENLSQYFRLNLRKRTPSLLHVAIHNSDRHLDYWNNSRFFTSAQMEIVRWFLEAGANPKIAIDRLGNITIPLVVLTYRFGNWDRCVCKESFWICFQNLLDAGCHLNQIMPHGEIVFDFLKKILCKRYGSPYYPNLDSTSIPPLPLNHLCSRVIRFHHIPIEKLPTSLQVFVRHGSTFLGQYSSFSHT